MESARAELEEAINILILNWGLSNKNVTTKPNVKEKQRNPINNLPPVLWTQNMYQMIADGVCCNRLIGVLQGLLKKLIMHNN